MATESSIASELLAIVRCPRCRGELVTAKDALHCNVCKLAYAVSAGVPNFLIEDAKPIGASR